MTDTDRFGQTLSAWLHEEGEHRVPDHLGEVLVQTTATRQRRWWSSHERWLPMATTSGAMGRSAIPRAVFILASIIALIGVLVGAAVLTGASRTSVPTLGTAGNGRIFVADGATIASYAADGTDRQVVAQLTAPVGSIELAPDGRRLAMEVQTTPGRIEVLDLDTTDRVTVPTRTPMDVGALKWAPNGTTLMFAGFDGTHEHLFIAPVDGTVATELVFTSIDRGSGFYPAAWSPAGDQIAFVATPAGSPQGTLYLASPTGTNLTTLVADRVMGDSAVWSPDPNGPGIVYTAAGNRVEIVDPVSGDITSLGSGFWPAWSPDGAKLSYWNDGTKVVATADALARTTQFVRAFPAFSGACQDRPDLAGAAFCGPAAWSPDGTRLIAADVTGDSILSLMADGSGSPIAIPMANNVKDSFRPVVWRPVWR